MEETSLDIKEDVIISELTVEQINSLDIDELLTMRKNNIKIVLKEKIEKSLFEDSYIIWNSNGNLDLDKEKAKKIILAVKGLNLQKDISAKTTTFVDNLTEKIDKFNPENKEEYKEFMYSLFNVSGKEDFKKLFKVSSVSLTTCKQKFDYLVNKLDITTINEAIFLVISLMLSEYKNKK